MRFRDLGALVFSLSILSCSHAMKNKAMLEEELIPNHPQSYVIVNGSYEVSSIPICRTELREHFLLERNIHRNNITIVIYIPGKKEIFEFHHGYLTQVPVFEGNKIILHIANVREGNERYNYIMKISYKNGHLAYEETKKE